eukprot:TRINITY_DN1338_c0_g1_i1.p1 TRINITY_DN1338_c0_g1~~TRINITY_DN1338_c0_g1_i1.p1  ORF type:complete len:316 (-),score=70.05 TRINITY_DN1338_c0_g1_i1:251-1198(-)
MGRRIDPGRFCGERMVYDYLFGYTIGWCLFGWRKVRRRWFKGRANLKVKDFYMKKYKGANTRPAKFGRWLAGTAGASCIPTFLNGGYPVDLVSRHLFFFWWGFFWGRRPYGYKYRIPFASLWHRTLQGAKWWRFMMILEILFYHILGILRPEEFPEIHNLFPADIDDEDDYDNDDFDDDDVFLPYRFQTYGSTMVPGVYRNYVGDAAELISKFKRMQLYHLPQFDTKGSLPEPFDPNKPKELLSNFVQWRGNEKKIRRQQILRDAKNYEKLGMDPYEVEFLLNASDKTEAELQMEELGRVRETKSTPGYTRRLGV